MAPYTYVGLALDAAPGSRIYFGSLEFVNTDEPIPPPISTPDVFSSLGTWTLWLTTGSAAPLRRGRAPTVGSHAP